MFPFVSEKIKDSYSCRTVFKCYLLYLIEHHLILDCFRFILLFLRFNIFYSYEFDI